jgi:hypothetical protein
MASREVTCMTIPHYVIRGGMEGRERLRVIARVMAPTTSTLLAEDDGTLMSLPRVVQAWGRTPGS